MVGKVKFSVDSLLYFSSVIVRRNSCKSAKCDNRFVSNNNTQSSTKENNNKE